MPFRKGMRPKLAHLVVLAILPWVGIGSSGAADVEAGLEAFRRQDHATALREWAPLAVMGNRNAQFHLAGLYADGLGVRRDNARAFELYREAAEAGSAPAQLALGQAYLTGRGVPPNNVLSTFWYSKAAEQGHAEAQYRLGLAYRLGLGIEKDLTASSAWYRRAAEQGHGQSQLELGVLLIEFKAEAVTDYEEAIRWLSLAADRNNVQAQRRLGRIFARGLGVAKDYARAIPFLRQAALAGISEAQFELGLIYEKGHGFRDPREARRWYAMAARGGFRLAQARLSFDPRLRAHHLRYARIFDGFGAGPARVRDPEEIRRGPAAPVRLAPTDDVYCDFFPRANHGGNRKFRCFMMSGPRDEGGHYYDASGNLRPAADGVVVLDTDRGPRPVLAAADGTGQLEPLTDRDAFARQFVAPLELKVKYRSLDDPEFVFERDMYSEVAATRLLWALHFPADRMYRVGRVHCHRCPRDPFSDRDRTAEGHYTTFDTAAIELRYRAGRAEKYDKWLDGGWSWGEELHRLRYAPAAEGFSEEQRKHFDGLIVLMNIVLQLSTPPHQNRLMCLRGNIQQLGPYKHCPDTVLLVHDLGATFGKRRPDSLETWRRHEVWADPERCETALPAETHNDYKVERYTIGQAGWRFILDLLNQLTAEHLRALFESAGFERFDVTLVPPGEIPTPRQSKAVIDAWIAGFLDKVEQVRSVACEGT